MQYFLSSYYNLLIILNLQHVPMYNQVYKKLVNHNFFAIYLRSVIPLVGHVIAYSLRYIITNLLYLLYQYYLIVFIFEF